MTRPVTRPSGGSAPPSAGRAGAGSWSRPHSTWPGPAGPPASASARSARSAGLTKRYFYESFDSIDQLGAAVVDHAIDVMVERTEPFRPGTAGGSVHAGIKAFIDALLDDRRLARILITETQAGSLSRFRGRIVEVAVASLLPVDRLAAHRIHRPPAVHRLRPDRGARRGLPGLAPGSGIHGTRGAGRPTGRPLRPHRRPRLTVGPGERERAAFTRIPNRGTAGPRCRTRGPGRRSRR